MRLNCYLPGAVCTPGMGHPLTYVARMDHGPPFSKRIPVPYSQRASALLAASVCAAFLLGGCAQSDDPEPAAKESPLTEFMSSVYGGDVSQEDQEKEYTERERKREDLVAQCMSEEGFEYTPNVQEVSFSMATVQDFNPDSREWVAQYGYGMINYPGREGEQTTEATEYVDLNADYVTSLSESEQTAFYEALHGPMPDEADISAEGEAMEWDWSTAGCYGWSEHEISGADPSSSDEHQPVMEAMNTLYEDMMASPELAAVSAEWAACMADAGHPGFSVQTDAQNSISDKMSGLYGDPDAAAPVDDAAMKAVGEEEIELALVDLDCREETGYRDTMESVQFKLEQQFIDDHKAELEAFRADLEQGS